MLVNSYSASAAEIVAGAVQDYDRGLIVGKTTFGKGLVQKQYGLENGGAVLLTVATYYTPSGRPIQRPYTDDRLAYLEEAHDGYDPNVDPDSIASKPIYYTEILKRKVYGSGGITPDVVVEPDSLAPFERRLLTERLVLDFASQYANRFTESFGEFDAYFREYRPGRRELSAFRRFLEERESAFTGEELEEAQAFLRRAIRRQFAQIRWGNDAEGRVRVSQDPTVEKAIGLFDKAVALLDSRHYHYNRHQGHLPSEDRSLDRVR